MNYESDIIIFLHIPKTAGSTLHALLGSSYPNNMVYNVFGARYSDPEIVRFLKMAPNKKEHIRLLKGHMPFGLHRYLPESKRCKYITVLRNPIERTISQYYYIKKNLHNPLHAKIESRNLSIAGFVRSGIAVGMNNGQCRFLNGDLDEYGFDQCDETMLDGVYSHIRDHFLWLGITERFDESLLVLRNLLGWSKAPYYLKENANPKRIPTRDVSPDDINVIKQYNALDLKLWDYANRLLDSEIAKIRDFESQYQAFKVRNARIQRRWNWLPSKVRRFAL